MDKQALVSCQKDLNHDEALLIEDPYDLFYFLKKPLSLGSLLIEKDKASLFVDGRYFSAFHQIKPVVTYPSENGGFLTYIKSSTIKTLIFDSEKTSYLRSEVLRATLNLEPRAQLLKHLRLIKSPEEEKLISQSSSLLVTIYKEFLTLPKLGLTEKQIASQFKILSLEKGAEDFSFEPIIAVGENSAYPHHRPTNRVLKEGDVMLVDVGVTLNSYQSDMTRMVFFGNVPKKLLNYHDQFLEAHQAALHLCKPGTLIGELDRAARSVFKKHGTEHLFCHSLGHGLGIETHESPRIKFDGPDKDLPLKKGMVITIEPGLYEEGLGGIRHEDLIVITENGYTNFYPSYF